ncbi:MAG: polysaccharide biosynthesis tyrosine autokinase, partial [Planctomycetota bacterium]
VEPKVDSRKIPNATQAGEMMHRSERVTDVPSLSHQSVQVGGPRQVGLSAKDIVDRVFRFKWIFLMVCTLVAAPSIAAIWITFVPKYRANAEVRIRPIIPYLVFRTEESGTIPLYDSFVNTQVPIISSVQVLQRVLDQPEVQQTGWYKNPPKSLWQRLGKDITPPIERLRETFSAEPRRETEIIDVAFSDSSIKDAKLILNTILDHYVKYVEEMSDATQDQVYRQLVDRHKSLDNDILGREIVIGELRASLGTATPEELVSQKRVRLDETQARLAEARQNSDLLRWELDHFSTYDSNDLNLAVTGNTETQPRYYEDEQWCRLDASVKSILHEIEASLRRPEHPGTSRARKDLKFAEELLRQREIQLDEQWRRRVPMTIAQGNHLSYAEAIRYLKHQLARAHREEQLLLADIEKQQTEFETLFKSAQLLDKQNAALLHKRGLFGAVRQRLDQKNMERNAPGSIEVLTKAVVLSRPFNDRRILLTVMVTALAMGAGSGAAFLKARRSDAIYSAQDMPPPMQAPFLGYVIVTDSRISVGKSLVSRYRQVKRDQYSSNESMRIVRTALLARLNGHDSTALLVTSTAAGTGKSHFTMMLGESLAKAGKKVLVIDADLQKMALTRRLSLGGKPGFLHFLRTGYVDREHIVQSALPGLSLLPAGQRGRTGMVYEEIANGAFKACVDELRQHYDIILLDSPPILTADATILSGQVDGTIMVEREFVSRRNSEVDALNRLLSSGGRLIGTVFVGSGTHSKYE